MVRKLVIGTLIGLLLLPGATTALAQGAGMNGSAEMSGQAWVDRSGEQPRLMVTADAADGQGWHLEAILTPVGLQRGAGGVGLVYVLEGQFTLSGPGGAVATGEATGLMDRGGVGQVRLADGGGTVRLDGNFSIGDDGALQLDLAGAFPAGAAEQSPLEAESAPAGTNHTFWFLSRAAGLSAFALLTINVCLGLMVSSRSLDAFLARWRAYDLHQFSALLALGFLGLHIFALLGDHYFNFRLSELLVPLALPYRPAWTALGVVAFYLMIGIVASFYVRRLIGYRTWRLIHYLTFGVYLLALAHGLFSGTDSGRLWAAMLYVGSATAVATLTTWRILSRSARRRPARARAADL
ncbi:MAG: ferric reductase-like transmembrane domain-containing protein [Ardenticatenaceae bacterium]|nr:ferric reductase-like transmembrane domain-containing protein [Ardenticatenaceae bacterium]